MVNIRFCVSILILAIFQPTWQKSVEIQEPLQHERNLMKRTVTSEPIHFPDDSRFVRQAPTTRPPDPCPDNALFCESTNDYPKAKIKDILKKNPNRHLKDHFYVEEVPDPATDKVGPHDDDEEPLCLSNVRIVYPQKVRSATEGLYDFVVNDDEHKQGVRVETCADNGGACKIPGSLSVGYSSRCSQKYIQRTLVVFNSTSNTAEGFVTKPFDFPSCCNCKIVNDSNKFGHGHYSPVKSTPKPRVNDMKSAGLRQKSN